MQVRLNGEAVSLPQALTVEKLLFHLKVDPTQVGIAVAINRRIIPRAEWSTTLLAEGDQVELVYARQGG
ncbi:MAG: sulfur carrier protein ThiS [Bacteroidia bacterium]|nr:sulfur carrier protein ThiS [Bacteroidia bacterium]